MLMRHDPSSSRAMSIDKRRTARVPTGTATADRCGCDLQCSAQRARRAVTSGDVVLRRQLDLTLASSKCSLDMHGDTNPHTSLFKQCYPHLLSPKLLLVVQGGEHL